MALHELGDSPTATVSTDAGRVAAAAGAVLLRVGLVVPLLWIGLQKFTSDEAAGIMPLITHEPAFGWLYHLISVQALSNAIGVAEIAAAVLIASRPFSATLSAVGSAIAVLLFVSTVSFLFTTPDVVAPSSLHVPLLTDTGGFLIKDITLLGAALWSLGEALRARSR